MRVIAGTARGRKLQEPADMRVRPTTDRVKESMFSIIQFYLQGAMVLDLFGGSGQLGIEAVSRGAERATICDASGDSVRLIKSNVKSVQMNDKIQVVQGDGLEYLRRGEKYNVILLDPPYDTNLLENALKNVIEFDNLSDDGIMICESKAEKLLPEVCAPYQMYREYKYGKIKLTVYRKIMETCEDKA